jgi:hypothetical protein
MSGITLNAEVTTVRPSRLAAEALVNRHDPEQVKRRARAMGISHDVADVVAAVCCRCADDDTTPVSRRSAGDSSLRS